MGFARGITKMSDSRETFERTVTATWSDSYSLKRAASGDYVDEILDGMWWAWQINCPQFTALCHSKTKQIGKPVGFLVQNEAGGLAAVHNLGRVTWLDDCVAGPVEQAARAQEYSAVMPDERGTNRYGLDMRYFRRLFNRELSNLENFMPDELARVLARAAITADASVLQESEFQDGAGKAGGVQ